MGARVVWIYKYFDQAQVCLSPKLKLQSEESH